MADAVKAEIAAMNRKKTADEALIFAMAGMYTIAATPVIGLAMVPMVSGMIAYEVSDIYYRHKTGKGVSESIYEVFRSFGRRFKPDPVSC